MEPTERNRRAWDELHRRPPPPPPPRGLPDVVRERLPELAAKHVLHLRCGTGEATAELAERGALVTAVDSSPDQLAAARRRAPNAAFVESDLHALPLELLRGRFHLVYSSGAGAVLEDIDRWAAEISLALRPGGYLLVHDEHPAAVCLDAMLHWRWDYFAAPGRQLGLLVTAVSQAGLVLRRLEEFPARREPRVPAELVLIAAKPRSEATPSRRLKVS